uniref:Maturation protein n=1 Tax=Christensen virus TaxID=2707205 RepID=A0A6H0DKA8_9VIRU|nr:MAG: maturation protein [Christensen virus]
MQTLLIKYWHHPTSDDPIFRSRRNAAIRQIVEIHARGKGHKFDEVVEHGEVRRFEPRRSFSDREITKSPHFKSRQRNGEIIVNPYQVQNIVVEYEDRMLDLAEPRFYTTKTDLGWYLPSQVRRWYGPITDLPDVIDGFDQYMGATYYIIGSGIDIPCQPKGLPELPFPFPWKNWDEDQAQALVTSAFAKINSGEWDMLTSLAEAKETVKFIADKLIAAAKLLLKLRHPSAFLGKPKDIVEKASSNWLEYRYAIMPLVYEVEDIASALENLGRLYNKVSSKSTSEHEESIDDGWQKDFDEVLVSYSVTIKRRYDPSTILSATDQMVGFNPLVTAWELVPFSFVVDWFINVGDLLAATTSIPDYCDQGATLGINVRRSASYRMENETSCGPVESHAKLLERSYYRRVIDEGEAGFQFQPDLHWRRYLDAFALSWGPLRKALSSNQSTRRV